MSNKTLETALMWRSLGIGVIPCLYHSKRPSLDKWKPYQERLPTEFELRAWFERPGYNIAVVTGWQGLVIVDFDDPAFIETSPCLPSTHQVATARGMHFYYYVIDPTRCVRLDGVDIKAAGGCCLTPPSIHPNGTPYRERFSDQWPDICHINSIADILPEYQQAISRPPPRPQISTLDPLDAAMLPHTSTSIESIKANWTIADVLNIKIRPGRVWHTVCPLHNDTNPSLAVYPDGHWWCYAEARGGDVIDLYAAIRCISIQEAIAEMGEEIRNGEK